MRLLEILIPSDHRPLFELTMNQRTFQQIADQYGNQINVGFEFEFTVPEDSPLSSIVSDTSDASTMRIREMDLSDFIEYFEVERRRAGITDAEDAFDVYYNEEINDELKSYVDDHWDDHLEGDEDREENEDDARDRAADHFAEHEAPSKEELFKREGPDRVIRETDTRPIYGYTDNNEDEFYTEEPSIHDQDEVMDMLIGTIEGELDDARINYDKVTSDGSVTWPGIEVVTEPQPLEEAIDTLWEMFDWMQRSDVQTDSSAGLHINISIGNIQQLDPLKLAVFLGEEYSLKMFNRLGNVYTQSQIQHLVKRLKNNEQNKLSQTFKDLSGQLKDMLMSGKYASFNLDKLAHGYLEFRIAGGKDYHRREQEVTQTIYRFATAMVVAANPNAYHQQYIKKISKLVQRADDGSKTTQLPRGIAELDKLARSKKSLEDTYNEYLEQLNKGADFVKPLTFFLLRVEELTDTFKKQLRVDDIRFLRKLYNQHQQQIEQWIPQMSNSEENRNAIYSLLRLNTQKKQMSQSS